MLTFERRGVLYSFNFFATPKLDFKRYQKAYSRINSRDTKRGKGSMSHPPPYCLLRFEDARVHSFGRAWLSFGALHLSMHILTHAVDRFDSSGSLRYLLHYPNIVYCMKLGDSSSECW